MDLAGLDTLGTESADQRLACIDTWSVAELAQAMNENDRSVPEAITQALPQLIPALQAVCARMVGSAQLPGGRLIYVGAGTPGRLGILDAAECPPTFSVSPKLVQGLIAGGSPAIVNAVEGAEDNKAAGAADIAALGVGASDSVLGISASGRTPYVIGALSRARELGACTVGFSCNSSAELSAYAEYAVEVVLGPEFIAGSTRLKAGTAQKLVLNMFSTIAMVRLGKTYGTLMVDVKASNVKLRERAIRLVRQISGADRPAATAALAAADWQVKPAVVMLLCATDAEAAERLLTQASGRLRAVLETAGKEIKGN
ncbi:MAG: N-acetylmuramic acid 6-phosphate etherase [Propionibacteriaceae bacterium]|jgi:N-acetylmuramic acid 6-phosphate etherase|nr:N-acetylmuramic acid 6-phosphate etherase [Propionibacteriaceae bacterium]